MRRVIIVSVMLILVIILLFVNHCFIVKLDKTIDECYSNVMNDFDNDNMDGVRKNIDTLKNAWDESQYLVGMTISSSEIEEIEISFVEGI